MHLCELFVTLAVCVCDACTHTHIRSCTCTHAHTLAQTHTQTQYTHESTHNTHNYIHTCSYSHVHVCTLTCAHHVFIFNFIPCYSIMFLIVISPMLQMAVFCLAYGREIEDLKFYYTNLDLPPAEGNPLCNGYTHARVRACMHACTHTRTRTQTHTQYRYVQIVYRYISNTHTRTNPHACIMHVHTYICVYTISITVLAFTLYGHVNVYACILF